MNRYFWLLARFIADDLPLPDRRRLYDRARNAMLDELSRSDPPYSAEERDYERLCFENSVSAVEASIARWGSVQAAR